MSTVTGLIQRFFSTIMFHKVLSLTATKYFVSGKTIIENPEINTETPFNSQQLTFKSHVCFIVYV